MTILVRTPEAGFEQAWTLRPKLHTDAGRRAPNDQTTCIGINGHDGRFAVVLLVPSTWTLAATQVDSNAVGANESSLFIAQDTRKTGQLKIIRIVPPENSQELGTVIFGEGESFLEPSALRGPR